MYRGSLAEPAVSCRVIIRIGQRGFVVGMSRQQIEAVVREVAESIADTRQLELVDVEYVKEPSGYFLRVFIDKEGGVGLDDCQGMSERLSERLDEIDPIPGSYSLEVSSPGLDRPLKRRSDYERYVGELVHIKTYAPVDGRKNWQGKLLGHTSDHVELEVDGNRVTLPFQSIARARLVPQF